MKSRESLTSVHVLAAEVVPVEEHQLDPVALVERHQADEQQQDGSQTSGQLHRVHELCWRSRADTEEEFQLQTDGEEQRRPLSSFGDSG